jgi:5'-phosphate synthase pdxT subunit
VSGAPLIGVLALQGDVREHERALGACGALTRRVRTVEDLEGLVALVVPGGESTTMSLLLDRTGSVSYTHLTLPTN